MTMNKAQYQTFTVAGVDLSKLKHSLFVLHLTEVIKVIIYLKHTFLNLSKVTIQGGKI